MLLVNDAVNRMILFTQQGDAAIEALTGHTCPWPDADPLTWAASHPPPSANVPRTMLVQGEIDELASPAGAEHFADAINVPAPGRVELAHAPWKKHTDLTRVFLDKGPQLTAPVTDWLGTFAPPKAMQPRKLRKLRT